MSNVIQIKHGEGIPAEGILAPYELGYATSNQTLYIGGWQNNKPQGIKVSFAGEADKAFQLSTARMIQVDLASASSAEFNGSVDISPGVTGTLPVINGGTGKASHTSNAILAGNGTNALKNVATANGAFYATSANGAAKFGTLPIAQGGTGATTAANARANLGLGSVATLSTVPIANGGTGATTAANARANLELGSVATKDTVPIANGGTGATSAKDALTNLGALSTGGGTLTGQITSTTSGNAWWNGRNYAAIKKSTHSEPGAFYPVTSVKSKSGSWEMGTHHDSLVFNYVSDDNYNTGINANGLTKQYSINTEGEFSGFAKLDAKPLGSASLRAEESLTVNIGDHKNFIIFARHIGLGNSYGTPIHGAVMFPYESSTQGYSFEVYGVTFIFIVAFNESTLTVTLKSPGHEQPEYIGVWGL